VTLIRSALPVALALALAGATAPPARAQTDSLGLGDATDWLKDSLPRAGSFTLHDLLNGQPTPFPMTRVLSDVRVNGCTMTWSVLTLTGQDSARRDSTRIVVTAMLHAVDPSLAAAVERDTVHTTTGRLTHVPAIWEVSAPTRDNTTGERLENPGTTLKVNLPAVSLFVTTRDDAWRTAAAIAAVARACQRP
jgi:hypothetical protein